jgi:hypothetical protein
MFKKLTLALIFVWPPAASSFEEIGSFCFPETVVRLPDRALRQRVDALLPESAGENIFLNTDLLKAVITHESGGNPQAISPTGCAGIGAICHQPFADCCLQDSDERLWYDKCSKEMHEGYFCQVESDPRFDPGFSVPYIDQYFREIVDLTAATRPELIAMGYNGGPGFLQRLMGDAGGSQDPYVLLRNMNLQRQGYPRSSTAFRITKMIELHDYVTWTKSLLVYWRAKNQPSVSAAARLGLERLRLMLPNRHICYSQEPSGWSIRETLSPEKVAPCGQPESLQIHRLEFGHYRKETISWCPA